MCLAHVDWYPPRPLHSLHLLSLFHLSYLPALPAALHLLLPWCRGLQPRALPLRSWVTWPKRNSSTGYEPNDHFITEAYVEYTQESLTEQRLLEEFDNDDVTIGQTLLNACRRRADHSEGEGLSSCLSSSSMSHDRTVKPVVCRDVITRKVTKFRDKQNSESEQIRTLLDRPREQILADCQAEIRKPRIPGWLWPKKLFKSWVKRSSRKNKKFVVLIKDTNFNDEINNFFMNSYSSKIRIHVKLMRKVSMKWKKLMRFQGSTFDTIARRRLVEDQDTILELTGIAKWN